ncbi:MAG TPA: c-type cytochrome [Thermoanaerobaculia bacterium]|nr:c-type cytochrome [Thermoanaerobaculia bacterium]
MKNFILGFLAALVLLVAGPFLYLRLGAADVNADVQAPGWLSRLTSFAVHASVARNAPDTPSSTSHTDADLIAGGTLYMDGCAGCHGRFGRPPRKRVYFTSPPEFAHVGTQYSEPQVIWIIKHGIRRSGMSPYGYNEKQLSSLAGFIKRMKDLPPPVVAALQPKKP